MSSSLEDEILKRENGFINEEFDICLTDSSQLATKLSFKDYFDSMRTRVKSDRSCFRVKPGLYKVGNPNQDSEVLVSANYKLTVDCLRKELEGCNVWVLILNTHGVNVWCAAGKKTFCTAELLYRVQKHHLFAYINHRRVIIPQLGASGISIIEAKKHNNIDVIVGPVRASDIKLFIDNDFIANEEQRKVTFNFIDRIKLIPLEIRNNAYLLLTLLVISFLYVAVSQGINDKLLSVTIAVVSPYYLSMLLAIVAFPVILFLIPARAFYVKGMFLSAVPILLLIYMSPVLTPTNFFNLFGHSCLVVALTSRLVLNFTGSTTFTSYSGVLIETEAFEKIFRYLIGLGIITLLISSIM